jgi:hypothetical protein
MPLHVCSACSVAICIQLWARASSTSWSRMSSRCQETRPVRRLVKGSRCVYACEEMCMLYMSHTYVCVFGCPFLQACPQPVMIAPPFALVHLADIETSAMPFLRSSAYRSSSTVTLAESYRIRLVHNNIGRDLGHTHLHGPKTQGCNFLGFSYYDQSEVSPQSRKPEFNIVLENH